MLRKKIALYSLILVTIYHGVIDASYPLPIHHDQLADALGKLFKQPASTPKAIWINKKTSNAIWFTVYTYRWGKYGSDNACSQGKIPLGAEIAFPVIGIAIL